MDEQTRKQMEEADAELCRRIDKIDFSKLNSNELGGLLMAGRLSDLASDPGPLEESREKEKNKE